MTTFELIERLKVRTGMYIGDYEITRFESFLYGYSTAKADYEIHDEPERHFLFPLDFRYMHKFAAVKCGEDSDSLGWRKLILDYCNGDEGKALDTFFEFFDEFKALYIKSGRVAVLTQENIDYHNSDCKWRRSISATDTKKTAPLIINPMKVYEIELSSELGWLLAIETDDHIETMNDFYTDKEKLNSDVAVLFRNVDNWSTLEGDNIEFTKPLKYGGTFIVVKLFNK